VAENRFSYRDVCYFVGANAIVFGLLCLGAQRTGYFYLRVVSEGFAAAYLVLLTLWVWLGISDFPKRLLAAIVAVTIVLLACRFVLSDGFSSWIESAIWYVPVTSVLCGALRLAGYTIERRNTEHQSQTFSIRTMMLGTAIIALLFPLIGMLVRSRAGGQINSILWLMDALVLVAPVSMIGIGLAWAVFSNKPFHAGALMVAAPVFGVLICRIYGWDFYQSMVLLTTTVAALVTTLTWVARAMGYRLVKRDS
jgi:hypothetical protein